MSLPAVARFSVLVVAGPDAGAVTSSRRGQLLIGQAESCDLRLADETVARFHCQIGLVDGRPILRDLDTGNGTLVDGVDVIEARLRRGSTVTIGATQLRFAVGQEELWIPCSPRETFGTMCGRSVKMRQLFAMLERAAASDVTVLLEGEPGTGKEAAAQSIHRESGRANGPFVVVDCGSIAPNLIESELFGHERGAFEAATGGTVFIDEIGELPTELQAKLLRVLEQRQIKRVGQSHHTPVDVRLIAATNRDLRSEVEAQRFRSELYYRLAVIQARLPALRERREDLPLLVEELLHSILAVGAVAPDFVRDKSFLDGLERYAWPGNVRELRNHLERCVALQCVVPLDHSVSPGVVDPLDPDQPLRVAREEWTRAFERRYLGEILRRNENNVTAAARAAGVDRIHFYRLLWRHGMKTRTS